MDSILQSGEGGLISKTKIPMQELELKMQGGLMREVRGRDSTVYAWQRRIYTHIQSKSSVRKLAVMLMWLWCL